MRSEIYGYILNFMLYKMIYFSSHKFAFSNLRFSPFYEHFRQLREKYAFKLKIKYIMLISLLSPIWWSTYIWLFLKKTTPLRPLHALHLPIQNILSRSKPFPLLFCKKLVGRKKIKVKTEGPIVFVFYAFFFYLSLAVQYHRMN